MLLKTGAAVLRVHEIIILTTLYDQGLPLEPTGVIDEAACAALGLNGRFKFRRWIHIVQTDNGSSEPERPSKAFNPLQCRCHISSRMEIIPSALWKSAR
jgi:hypothetical protein